jgi:hypothetical protein
MCVNKIRLVNRRSLKNLQLLNEYDILNLLETRPLSQSGEAGKGKDRVVRLNLSLASFGKRFFYA